MLSLIDKIVEMVVNFLRKGGGQFAPENNQNVTWLEVVNLLRNQVVSLTGFSSSLLVLISYRTGIILVSSNVGYYTAFLITSSFYLFELISGNQMVDHNDVIFFFYISVSIWAWLEYVNSKKKYWLILIGVFSGFAVMTKWLVGLLVYSGWSLYIILNKYNRSDKTAYFAFFISIFVTCCIVLPWQFLILEWYPTEAKLAYHYNTDHFFNVIEGHNGPWWYYFGNLQYLYGTLSLFIIPIGLLLLARKIRLERTIAIALISYIIIVYVFYSCAKTKMISFPFVVSLPIFLGLGCFIDYIIQLIYTVKLPAIIINASIFLFLITISVINFRPKEIIANHSLDGDLSECRKVLISNKNIFLKCKANLPPNTIIFNLKGRTYIDCMFYTGFPSYNFIPSFEQYSKLISNNQKYSIVILNMIRKDCPEYLRTDSSILFIKESVRCCD